MFSIYKIPYPLFKVHTITDFSSNPYQCFCFRNVYLILFLGHLVRIVDILFNIFHYPNNMNIGLALTPIDNTFTMEGKAGRK